MVDLSQTKAQIALLLENYPELEADSDLRLDMIEGETDAYRLLERLVEAEQSAKAMQAAIKDIVDGLSLRKDRYKARQEKTRQLMLELMGLMGAKSVGLPMATLSVSTKKPSVIITDESAIPGRYWQERITRSPDKASIKEALDAGGYVEGAALSNGGETLTVRVK